MPRDARHGSCSVVRMEHALLKMLKILNASHVCAAARVLSDGSVEVWLGDADYGIRASALFSRSEMDLAARWLSDNAVKFYPRSPHARVARLLSGWVAGALQA